MNHSGNGKGSTLVVYDLYLDEESHLRLALSPRLLHEQMKALVVDVGMQHRAELLDVWETADSGPATSFHSLEESHARITSVAEFARVETWPAELHMNGEVQLCNYSRDNASAAKQFVRLLVERLQPKEAHFLVISRGPGPRPRISGPVEWKRGTPLQF